MKDQARVCLSDVIPDDHSKQSDAFRMFRSHANRLEGAKNRLLDLGAGAGNSFDRLARIVPSIDYTGLDIESSPEVSRRKRSDLRFVTYDGEMIPFEDQYFDAIFCKQVLEHVRRPDVVIAEVARVLKPGGLFVGSVSQLEPYHSHSIFNWTAYGLYRVLSDHGLKLLELRPGIDGVSLTLRRIFGRDKFERSFSVSSLFNYYIDLEQNKNGIREKNFQKLIIAGHIVFAATR